MYTYNKYLNFDLALLLSLNRVGGRLLCLDPMSGVAVGKKKGKKSKK